MLVKNFFKGVTLDPDFKGFVTADDMVLAVDVSEAQDADVGDYAIAQLGLKSTDGSLNPEKKTVAYIRAGKSTTKTGNQRVIGFEADRYIGDEFQDFVLSHKMKYATGQKAVVNYIYIDRLTGGGEKGAATLLIDKDAGGSSEDPLGISGSLEKNGGAPDEYQYEQVVGLAEAGT